MRLIWISETHSDSLERASEAGVDWSKGKGILAGYVYSLRGDRKRVEHEAHDFGCTAFQDTGA